MTFLPDGRLLVSEKKGALKLVELGATPAANKIADITGVPAVAYGGQGGLGDVVLHPQFAANGWVYLSYAEAGDGGRGAAVARARLILDDQGSGKLETGGDLAQVPKCQAKVTTAIASPSGPMASCGSAQASARSSRPHRT